METIQWDDSLSVHVDEVDDDHRKIVELFNRLVTAVSEGNESSQVGAVLEELLSYTSWHFRHEERLMIKYGYDGYDHHKAEHEDLITAATDLQRRFLEAGEPITSKTIEFLKGWLTHHILGTDMEMGFYLSEVM